MNVSLSTKEILYIIDAMERQWGNPKKKHIVIFKKRIGGFDDELWYKYPLHTNLRKKLLRMLESTEEKK